ncbi:RNA polymerase II transcription elongation factor-domain-containing protein [Gautieria morchelliformis]|nr:RNA polymerase II transcription elongation factor-domain-containing protein [Gautieria morchelliformis]
MAAAASACDPLTGRRGVDIGTSFTRAWNERTGKTTKRSKDYPNPEYYSLRYQFKPESIDKEAAGSLAPKAGDGRVFELELPSQQGDSHRFTAIEQPSKEWECVLLLDPATQQLTIEKLESTLNLNYDGRGKGHLSASASSSAAGASRTKRPAPSSAARVTDLDEDIERTLTGYSDAEGEPDDDMDIQAEIEAIAGVSAKQEEEEEEEEREEEEEEEEEEMEPVDVEPPPPPPPPAKPKAPARAPIKAATKAKTKGRARSSTSAKREVDGIEEEELNFGEPTKRTRHPRRSSTAYNSNSTNAGLASSAAQTHNRHAPPTPSDLLRPPSTAQVPYAGSESESEESDEGGEVDAAALERELELELAAGEPDEDDEMEAIPIEKQHNSGRPLSLNELFGEQSQAERSQGDDDTTSDDSDDD